MDLIGPIKGRFRSAMSKRIDTNEHGDSPTMTGDSYLVTLLHTIEYLGQSRPRLTDADDRHVQSVCLRAQACAAVSLWLHGCGQDVGVEGGDGRPHLGADIAVLAGADDRPEVRAVHRELCDEGGV